MIRIDSYPARELFLTHTQTYLRQGSLRSPLVQLKYNRGKDQRRTLKDTTNLPRGLGTLTRPWAYAISSPHILTTSRVRTLTARVPGLS